MINQIGAQQFGEQMERNTTTPPSTYNELPVSKTWKSVGGKPKAGSFIIVTYGRFRLAQCANGYALLCIENKCHNLSSSPINYRCVTHNKGLQTYTACIHSDCIERPVYGYEHKKPLYCKDHRPTDAHDVTHLTCKILGCGKRATFGEKGKKEEYCGDHKSGTMKDVRHKLCGFPDCPKHPNFGNEGESIRYCKDHKSEEMIDLTSSECQFDSCTTRPSFAEPGDRPRFCKRHSTDEMINVVSKRCEIFDCTDLAYYGFDGKKIQYCSNHKLEGMLCVKSHRCKSQGCVLRPSYGSLYTMKKIFCLEHSSLNHYHKDKLIPICQVIDCSNVAHFINSTDLDVYPIRCHIHKHSTDIELTLKVCSSCQEELYFPSDKKTCMNCGKYRNKKIFKLKELVVKDFLISNNISFIHDKPIIYNGSTRRPDFVIASVFGYIIVEVDEYQHDNYDKIDEINRMMEIYGYTQSLNKNFQVLFIRFNPDYYIGLQYNLKNKYRYLYFLIIHYINQLSIGVPLGQIKLFYDEFNGNPTIEPL
jgi:hypothetical protein